MSPPDEVRRLVGRAQAGDADAARRLYRLHVTTVLRVVRPWCAGEADAEDLAQETFERAFASLSRYEAQGGKPFLAWLLTIALNAARTRSRHFQRRSELLDRVPAGDAPAKPDLAVERAERRRALLEALDELEERERTVVSLRYGAEWPAAEVAALLGLEEANVRKICERARRQLLERLAPKFEAADGSQR